jgi:hypothetical protein
VAILFSHKLAQIPDTSSNYELQHRNFPYFLFYPQIAQIAQTLNHIIFAQFCVQAFIIPRKAVKDNARKTAENIARKAAEKRREILAICTIFSILSIYSIHTICTIFSTPQPPKGGATDICAYPLPT